MNQYSLHGFFRIGKVFVKKKCMLADHITGVLNGNQWIGGVLNIDILYLFTLQIRKER